MSYSLSVTSAAVQSGNLILTLNNGTTLNAGYVMGAAGASGDLFSPISKTAAFTPAASEVTGSATPVYVVNATSAALTATVDPAILWNATTSQSLAVCIKRDPTDVSGNVVTVAPKSGSKLENSTAGLTEPAFFSYTIIATSPTTLIII